MSNLGDPSLASRFWAKVDRRGEDECWPWLGTTNESGYGSIVVERRLRKAGSVSLELAGIPQPIGKRFACHTCDNPPCVNPSHLWWGSNSENVQDSVNKGRHAQAAKTHCNRGHPLFGDNLYTPPNGYGRVCKSCKYASLLRARKAMRAVRGEQSPVDGPRG